MKCLKCDKLFGTNDYGFVACFKNEEFPEESGKGIVCQHCMNELRKQEQKTEVQSFQNFY